MTTHTFILSATCNSIRDVQTTHDIITTMDFNRKTWLNYWWHKENGAVEPLDWDAIRLPVEQDGLVIKVWTSISLAQLESFVALCQRLLDKQSIQVTFEITATEPITMSN
jgi:hypothetical protein